MTYGEVRATTVCLVLILDSRFWGTHIGRGGKFEAFCNVLCILGVFLRVFGILAGDPQEDSWK